MAGVAGAGRRPGWRPMRKVAVPMTGTYQAIPISDRVYWVGAVDWELRDFHGYLTSRGSTYNAYLIMAEKITLIDVVKAPFRREMIARIASVVDPERIEFIISNHAEMDHSGCLPEVIAQVKPEAVFASPMGVKALQNHFHQDLGVRPVKTGDDLDLGDDRLRFIETRMLHWPDSMFSFLEGEGILFSNDAFGMHLATHERFADQVAEAVLREESAKYFANIVMPFSPVVRKLVQTLPSLNLAIKIVAPDHGPIWRTEPERIIKRYAGWAEQKRTRKTVIVYDTMWGSTAAMARAVAEGISAEGCPVKVMPLNGSHRSDVATELLDAGALVVGTPTLNGQMFPTVADLLSYTRGLKPKQLMGAVFGSYGWGGEAIGHVEEILTGMGAELAAESVRVVYVPDDAALQSCRRMGQAVAAKLKG